VVNSNPIPLEKAIELCIEYRKKNKVRLLSQCWVCLRYSKEDHVWMRFHDPPENRGCEFVNSLFDKLE
jgi:hypothetical protein